MNIVLPKSKDLFLLKTEPVLLSKYSGNSQVLLFSWFSNSLSLLLDAMAPIVEWGFPHSPGLDDLKWGETCKPLVCA